MKLFVSKGLLHALTSICILSITACATFNKTENESKIARPSIYFDTEAYILNPDSTTNFRQINEFTNVTNLKVSAAAKNIKGYYLIKRGDIINGVQILTDNYNAPGVTGYIKTMNELWRTDVMIDAKDIPAAKLWANRVFAKISDKETQKALQTYCHMHKTPPADRNYVECLNKRLMLYSEEITREANTDKAINILLVSSKNEPGGALYYYSRNLNKDTNKKLKLIISRKYREGNWDFLLDIDNARLSGNGYDISFRPDLPYLLRNLPEYAELYECKNVLIGTPSYLSSTASGLVEIINDPNNPNNVNSKLNFKIIAIDRNPVEQAHKILSEWENDHFCVIAAGTDNQINALVPTVKQYISNNLKQKVFLFPEYDDGKYYSGEYINYYGESFTFPGIDLALGNNIKDFSKDYKESTGKDTSAAVLIGYDMMNFIYNTNLNDNQEDEVPYITDIIAIANNKVIRKIIGFYVDRYGAITELNVLQPIAYPANINTENNSFMVEIIEDDDLNVEYVFEE